MRKIIPIVLVMVLLASVVPMAITPAAAVYEEKIPFAGEDDELTKEELVNAILPYMLGEGDLKLDNVGDAAWVYAYWDGEPKTDVDMYDRTVAFYRPIERVISLTTPDAKAIVGLGAADRLVGLSMKPKYAYPLDLVLPEDQAVYVGSWRNLNMELALALKPDVIFVGYKDAANTIQEKTGIPTVARRISWSTWDGTFEVLEGMGGILGKEEEAEELISFMEGKLAIVTDITSEIPGDEKPRVYFSWWTRIDRPSFAYDPIEAAGGILVSKDVGDPTTASTTMVTVSIEQIIKWNPDIWLVQGWVWEHSYNVLTVEDVLTDSRLQTVNAVKNGSAYFSPGSYWMMGTDVPHVLAETFHMAKLFHPSKFEEVDMEKECNEIFERFYGVDGVWTKFANDNPWLKHE